LSGDKLKEGLFISLQSTVARGEVWGYWAAGDRGLTRELNLAFHPPG